MILGVLIHTQAKAALCHTFKARRSNRKAYSSCTWGNAARHTLLADLDSIEFFFPRSYSVIQEDFDDGIFSPTSAPPALFPGMEEVTEASDMLRTTERDVHGPLRKDPTAAEPLDVEAPSKTAGISDLTRKEAL